jgi:hypothetical protein
VRVIDALAVHKDADGGLEVVHLSNLTRDEAVELGSKVAALIGLGIAGEGGFKAGLQVGAEAAAEHGFEVFSEEDAWDVVANIPDDSAAALILLEHHWAIPLCDAIAGAGTDFETASRRLELAGGRHGNLRSEGFTRVIELVVDETRLPLEHDRAHLWPHHGAARREEEMSCVIWSSTR